MTKPRKTGRIILSTLALAVSAILTIINMWEWFTVAVLKNTAEYPFGEDGTYPYYYKSAKIYATVNLFWGLVFTCLLIATCLSVYFRKRILTISLFILTLLTMIGMLYHATIGVT